jgi:hypothetical protein
MAQVIEHLPSQHKALSSNPSILKKKKNLSRRHLESRADLTNLMGFMGRLSERMKTRPVIPDLGGQGRRIKNSKPAWAAP